MQRSTAVLILLVLSAVAALVFLRRLPPDQEPVKASDAPVQLRPEEPYDTVRLVEGHAEGVRQESGDSQPPPLKEPEKRKPNQHLVAEREEAEFRIQYLSKSVDELEEEEERLSNRCNKLKDEAIAHFFETGRYEVLGHGNKLAHPAGDQYKLAAHRFVPIERSEKKEIQRVELPPHEYPEAYALLRKIIWLQDEITGRRVEERKQQAEEDG